MRLCTVPGCDRKHVAIGLCIGHYQQKKAGKAFHTIRPVGIIGCKFPGCTRPHSCKGYCRAHWEQQHKGRELKPARRNAPAHYYKHCRATGCANKPQAHGLCWTHLRRFKQHGDIYWDREKTTAAWWTNMVGKTAMIMREGKREPCIFMPAHPKSRKGWVRVCVLLFEKLTGRQAVPEDRISLINGIPTNLAMRNRLFRCKQCHEVFVSSVRVDRLFCSSSCHWNHYQIHRKKRFSPDDIIDIRLARAAGTTLSMIGNAVGISMHSVSMIVRGAIYRSVPFQKKGQSFDEYLMEAMAYRSREAQSRRGEKRIPNSLGSERVVEEP